MSLISLFNFNYLKENIKKSKAIIFLCMFLLPIINGIVFLMNCSGTDTFMPNIYELSGGILLGLYFIPIILSLTLFNFIYKRNSSDFVLSMPLNKKQIFLTNTLGGIAVIFLMQVVNFVIIFLISLIYSGVIISYRMLFDIFVIYFVSYVFVFLACNIAISVSSNKITTVVVTLLILFLLPFIGSFVNTGGFGYDISSNARIECISDSCRPLVYDCDNVKCEIDKKNSIYRANISKIYDDSYTLPYGILYGSLFGLDSKIDFRVSLIKMGILSVVYLAVGLILFMRKKFEIVGTSFRSEKAHIFVRTLTTIPIVCVAYVIVREMDITFSSYDLFGFIFLLVLIFAYLFIYDLITRKKIGNFFKMMISLCVVGLFVVMLSFLFDDGDYNLDVNNVDMITFTDIDSNIIGSTKNREVVDYAFALLMDTKPLDEIYYTYYINASIGNDTYRFSIYATKDDYNYINGVLEDDSYFMNTSSRHRNVDVFGIGYYDGYVGTCGDSKLADMIINKYRDNGNVFALNGDNELFNITLYFYNDFGIRNAYIDVYGDRQLSLGLLRYYNSNTKSFFDNIDSESDIYSYYINGNYSNYESSYYSEIGNFIVHNIDDDIDIDREYAYIVIYGKDGKSIFVTNKVSELEEINKKYVNSDDELVMQMRQIMINLDYQSRTPIYEQIVNGIEKYVALGILKEKMQIPSIREMASSLGINPNTVKKSYDILEHKGIIVTISTKGTFIADDTRKITNDKIDSEIDIIRDRINELTKMGIDYDEIIRRIKR